MTHYGLGGLCETHIDPYGYIEGAGLYDSPVVQRLRQTGDIFATLMGYLNHVEAGGATAFCEPGHEEILRFETFSFQVKIQKKLHFNKIIFTDLVSA